MGKAVEILIIDDDNLVLASLSDYLVTKEYIAYTAATAREGIAQFERHQPQVVLLDQNLPDGSGLDLCRQILQINPKSKIIFITGYATVQYAVDAMRAGAFHYLSKPFELEELLIAIEFACKNILMEEKLRVRDYQHSQVKNQSRLVDMTKSNDSKKSVCFKEMSKSGSWWSIVFARRPIVYSFVRSREMGIR